MVNFEDDFSQDTICEYMNYLINECNLNVSIHISEKYFILKCNSQLSGLLQYNRHISPYCVYVKNVMQQQRKCVICQNMAARKCLHQASYIGSCHAGVKEYVRRIVVDHDVMGFVSVSGYKDENGRGKVNTIYDRYLKPEPVPKQLLDAVIPPLCIMLSKLFENIRDVVPNDTLYSRIQDYLAENHSSVTLDDISKKFSYSKSYISHMFKKESGLRLKAYCNNLKIEDATRLLYQTEISVTEIAFMVGFNNFSYFINIFKKIMGMTPLEYRNSMRKRRGNTNIAK